MHHNKPPPSRGSLASAQKLWHQSNQLRVCTQEQHLTIEAPNKARHTEGRRRGQYKSARGRYTRRRKDGKFGAPDSDSDSSSE